MLSFRADERAAMAFDDLASAIDAGLPLESLGGNVELGDHVLLDLAWSRNIKLTASEKVALEVGWKAGKGAATLRARAESRRRRAEFVRSMWSNLRYPLLLLGAIPVAGVCVSAVVGWQPVFGLLAIYAALAVLAVVVARKLSRGDKSLESWPGIGGILQETRELPYLETLHAQYGAGVAIVEAHRDAVRSVRQQGLRERLAIAQRMLEEGKTLSESLHGSASLHQETRSLLGTGERAGDLEDALARALQRRQDVAANRMATFARVAGGVIYVLAAVAVFLFAWKFYSSYFAALQGLSR